MRRFGYAVIMVCAVLLAIPAVAKDKVEKLTFSFDGSPRTYYSLVPEDAAPEPLVLLLHGSGRNGLEMTDAWKALATAEHFIIAAPNSYDPAIWQSDKDSPDFLREVVNQVKSRHPVDPSRIYLFGNSGGAVYALELSLIDSEGFAAAAVHAGSLAPANYDLFQWAKRKMPIAIWVGDHDPNFPLDTVKATKAAFEAKGFLVDLYVIPNHSHSYADVYDEVNRKAWDFLKRAQLPQADLPLAP
ncbi:MAG TPA: dienelactone hydrolase family protein [Acidisarcina sp.]